MQIWVIFQLYDCDHILEVDKFCPVIGKKVSKHSNWKTIIQLVLGLITNMTRSMDFFALVVHNLNQQWSMKYTMVLAM